MTNTFYQCVIYLGLMCFIWQSSVATVHARIYYKSMTLLSWIYFNASEKQWAWKCKIWSLHICRCSLASCIISCQRDEMHFAYCTLWHSVVNKSKCFKCLHLAGFFTGKSWRLLKNSDCSPRTFYKPALKGTIWMYYVVSLLLR